MTRLRLINWHNFKDDTIDFKNITYLLGVNAVGKTTIMDAIRYCLTTNKDFNTAGNKKSGRTLLGSVHQKQRADNSYLRPKHTVSYIGIEFLDESINKTFVITVRVESEAPKQDLRGVYQDWYITKPGYSLEDIPYFTKVKDGIKPTSREAFKLGNKGMYRASNQADAKERICRSLGIGEASSPNGKKFNEVFHLGTSLEDIKDIREFICTYILPEPEINIDVLQKDMQELERLQETLNEAQDREILLEEINEKMLEAQTRYSKMKVNQILVDYANYQDNLEQQQEKARFVSDCKSRINILTEKLDRLSTDKDKAYISLQEAQRDADNNAEGKKIASLEQENEENIKKYNQLISEAKTFDEILEKLSLLKKGLNTMGFSCDWVLNANSESISLDEKTAEIKEVAKIFRNLYDLIENRNTQIRMDILNLSNKKEELENKIKSLEKGIMCYPEEAILVRDKINDELRNKSKEGNAKLLCELLYMTDDSWQDTVESYLNTQRFNIIVTPKNYPIAKQVFISLGDRVKGIGVVDTRKLVDTAYTKGNISYLSDKVESENIYAKRYTRFVMKNVVCCDSADTLEEYEKSVSKDCLRFQNFCLQRMGRKEHFIGVDAIEKQLNTAKNELVGIKKDLTKLNNNKNDFGLVYNAYNNFMFGNNFELLENYCDSKQNAKQLNIKITEIKERIREYKKSPLLLLAYNRVDECEKNLRAIENEITDNKAEKQNLENSSKEATKVIVQLKENIMSLKATYENALNEYPQYASDVENKYQSERKTKTASKIASSFNKRVSQEFISCNDYINRQLIPLQQQYTTKYICDYLEGIEGASQYQKEYLSLKNIELERHREELEQAQIRCQDRFRKEILCRMKSDILNAKRQFKQINRVMENLQYGEESYRFSIDKSKDKELSLFYDIIMDKDNQYIDRNDGLMAFSVEATQSELFKSQLEDFMSKIMIDAEEHAKANLTGQKSSAKSIGFYIDYRTYLDYDIIVKNSVDKIEVPLSKVSSEGSGGENQSPFYIAICASLLQIYQQNPEGCIRLILLDEAFNNMTSDRIEPMMNMFKKLNFQVVLIATVEKATSICPYCDITYSIVKLGNKNAISVITRGFERI